MLWREARPKLEGLDNNKLLTLCREELLTNPRTRIFGLKWIRKELDRRGLKEPEIR